VNRAAEGADGFKVTDMEDADRFKRFAEDDELERDVSDENNGFFFKGIRLDKGDDDELEDDANLSCRSEVVVIRIFLAGLTSNS
jgi:hypothetical protein